MAIHSDNRNEQSSSIQSDRIALAEATVSTAQDVLRSHEAKPNVDSAVQHEMWSRIVDAQTNGKSNFDLAAIADSYGNKAVSNVFMQEHYKTFESALNAINQAEKLGASDAAKERIATALGAPTLASFLRESNRPSQESEKQEAPGKAEAKAKLSDRLEATPKQLKDEIGSLLKRSGHLPELVSDVKDSIKFIESLHARSLGEVYKLPGEERDAARQQAQKTYVGALAEVANDLESQLKKHPNLTAPIVADKLSQHGQAAREQIDSLSPETVTHLGVLRQSARIKI
jgi:hypothetical protein